MILVWIRALILWALAKSELFDVELNYIVGILRVGDSVFMELYFSRFYDLRDYGDFVEHYLLEQESGQVPTSVLFRHLPKRTVAFLCEKFAH
jgi:hypothetical protein